MKRLFYETNLIFRLNPLILDIFSKNGVRKPVKLVHSRLKWAEKGQIGLKNGKIGYFQQIWIFSEQQDLFVGSVTCRFQADSKPVIFSYFLWHFIVG